MPRRTYPTDAGRVEQAADLEHIVQDKRADWRATGAKARRRQRRYKNLLTQQLIKGCVDLDELDRT
jgi:hypothetical protein